MTTTVVIRTDYSRGLAFTGKAAAEIVKLLDQAIDVTMENRHGVYDWWQTDPDSKEQANTIYLLTRDVRDESAAVIRLEHEEMRKKLERHKEMIEAAEQLNPETTDQ